MAKNWNIADEDLLKKKVKEWNEKGMPLDMEYLSRACIATGI